jgi:hypothetical protein
MAIRTIYMTLEKNIAIYIISLSEQGLNDSLNKVGGLHVEVEQHRIVRVVLQGESVALHQLKVGAGTVRIKDLLSGSVVLSGVDDKEGLSVNLLQVSSSLKV